MTTLWVLAAVVVNTAAGGVEIKTVPDTPLFVDRGLCLEYIAVQKLVQTACLHIFTGRIGKGLREDPNNGTFEYNILMDVGVPRRTEP